MNLSDVPALIRTYFPYLVGLALGWLYLRTGVELRGGPGEVAVLAFTIAVITNLWYVLIRVVETYWPIAGIMLGWPKSPTYERVDDLFASLVRTCIPPFIAALVVSVLAWIADAFGVVVGAEFTTGAVALATTLASALYYTVSRALLARFPRLAFLLGVGQAPVRYVARHSL